MYVEISEQKPELPPPNIPQKDEEMSVSMSTTTAESGEFPNQETSTDVIYVNNNRKVKMVTSEPESDLLILEYGTERIVEGEQDNEPPPLPMKKKHRQDNIAFVEERQYRIIDGLYVFKNVIISLICLYCFNLFILYYIFKNNLNNLNK